MVKDRLAELQAKHEIFCQTKATKVRRLSVARYSCSELQLDLCLFKVSQIDKRITAVSEDVQQMKYLQSNILSNPLIDNKGVTKLERNSDEIFEKAGNVQKEILEYRKEVAEMHMQDSHERLIKSHLDKVQTDLIKVRNEYKAAQVDFIEKTRKLHQREFDIMMAKHDDEDDPDDPKKFHTPLSAEFLGDYFAEAEKVKMQLREIKDRDTKIKKIEESVIEVNQLFKEVNALLMEQGEKLDTIERHVEKSGNYVEQGALQLKQAQKYQDKSRRRKICIAIVVVVIVIIVTIIVVSVSV